MKRLSLAEYQELIKKPKQRHTQRRSTIVKERVQSEGEATLAKQMKALKISFEQEYRFDLTRQWKADFHIMGQMILIEVEGGIWTQGRHTRGKGYSDDMEKYNSAQRLGYCVYRYSTEQVKRGVAIQQIEKILEGCH